MILRIAFIVFLTLPLTACLRAADVQAMSRVGNVFFFTLTEGAGEIEWISESTFRFARWPEAPGPRKFPRGIEPVQVEVTESLGSYRFATDYVVINVSKRGMLLTIRHANNTVITADAAEIRREGNRFILERESPVHERFRGLGDLLDPTGEGVRGKYAKASRPFLISTLGYAEYYPAGANHTFDLAASNPGRRRVEVEGDRLEYYFHYGAVPKEIMEEHLAVGGALANVDRSDYEIITSDHLPKEAFRLPAPASMSWEGLREIVLRVFAASYSAIVLPAMDLTALDKAEGELARRATQLMSVLPLIHKPSAEKSSADRAWLTRERARLVPFLATYAWEAQERGAPIIRPLSMQYTRDVNTAGLTDQFMLGDELLIAPMLEPGNRRSLYLPMGIWTHLRTNTVYKGRQRITFDAEDDELPIFARNGSIIPFATTVAGAPLELHYFPSLAAELFLYEGHSGVYSQMHAAPVAGSFMRLEIESIPERLYHWTVHNIDRCQKIVSGSTELVEVEDIRKLKPKTWFYDAQTKNLHVRTRVPAGATNIINVSF